MRIYSIGQEAQKHWPWLESYVERSIGRNVDGRTASDALQDVLSGDAVFLVVEDGADVLAVSKVDIAPDCIHVHTLTGTGLEQWIEAYNEVLTTIAQGLGKAYITTTARLGWVDRLKAMGWKTHSVLLTRKVA